MYSLYSSPESSPLRRRIVSEANVSDFHSLLEKEEQELLLRDWQLERRQLQIENQRLTKLLGDAHKHIRILKKQQELDDGLVSVSSTAATVKAGSSSQHQKLLVEKRRSRSSSPCKRGQTRKLLPKLFRGHETQKEVQRDAVHTTTPDDITSCDAVKCDVRGDKDTVIVCLSMLRARTLSKSLKHLLPGPDESFDSTAASSSGAPSMAEF